MGGSMPGIWGEGSDAVACQPHWTAHGSQHRHAQRAAEGRKAPSWLPQTLGGRAHLADGSSAQHADMSAASAGGQLGSGGGRVPCCVTCLKAARRGARGQRVGRTPIIAALPACHTHPRHHLHYRAGPPHGLSSNSSSSAAQPPCTSQYGTSATARHSTVQDDSYLQDDLHGVHASPGLLSRHQLPGCAKSRAGRAGWVDGGQK